MYLSKTERKHVVFTCSHLWTAVLGAVLERYHNSEPWAIQASVIDKATAEQYLTGSTLRLDCSDADVSMNLRMRYRQAIFAQCELPERCNQHDSVLLVKKRNANVPAEPGEDNRYHFFLIKWMDPSEAALELELAQLPPEKRNKADGSGQKGKRRHDEVTEEMVIAAQAKKRRHQKGMSAARYANRWHG